jgi:hypothetical protein
VSIEGGMTSFSSIFGTSDEAVKPYDQARRLDPREKYALEGKKACAGK